MIGPPGHKWNFFFSYELMCAAFKKDIGQANLFAIYPRVISALAPKRAAFGQYGGQLRSWWGLA
jgi:hypothetical protein